MKNASNGPIGFYIGNMNRSGGTERVLSQITTELVHRGWQICIINMYGNEEEAPFYPFPDEIRRIWLLNEYPVSIKDHVTEIRALRRCLKRERFSILIELDLILSIYSAPARIGCGVPLIAWEHFNYYYQYRKHNKLHRVGMRIAAFDAQKIVVLTKEDQGYYEAHFPWLKGRLVQIYNPNSYQVADEDVPEWGSRKYVVLAAGRLTPAKGFTHLIRSWQRLEQEFPEWELWIAGEGESRDQLERQIQDAGLQRIKLLGNVSQERMRELYRIAGVFAFPSIWEGFGLVLTEAMNYGMPCVAFSCKAGPSEIVQDLQNGFLVETGDEKVFADKLRLLMQSPILCASMGARARKSCSRFALSTIADQWEAFFKNMGVCQ